MGRRIGGLALANNKHRIDPIGAWSFTEGLDDILKKSCQLMARQGFHGTSMRDLAQETGRSLSGLYHYFRNKEDLLFLINLGGFTTLNNTWGELTGALKQPSEKLYAFIYFHIGYFVEHMDEMRVMTWGTQALSLEKARMIQKLKDRYTEAAKQIVKELHQAGNGREPDDRRLSRETYLLFGMMNWTFSWYAAKEHGSVAELINDIYRMFLSGIAAASYDEGRLTQLQDSVSQLFEKKKTSSMWAQAMAARSDADVRSDPR